MNANTLLRQDGRVTPLERVVARALECHIEDVPHITQDALDLTTPQIMAAVTEADILAHMREVYADAGDAHAYSVKNAHIQPALVHFIHRLGEGDYVLDLGCGTGRDAWYMAVPDATYRRSLMTDEDIRREHLPKIALRVVGVDASTAMIREAASVQWDDVLMYHPPLFVQKDMYTELGELLRHAQLDGIWSNASFLTHTPQVYVLPILRHLVQALHVDGTLALTYTQRTDPLGGYDTLKRSSSGRIKYFSRPRPEEVSQVARECGLVCDHYATHDYRNPTTGEVVPNLFVTQFFRKGR